MAETDKFGGLFRKIGDTIHIGTKKFKGKAILSSKFDDSQGESLIHRVKAEENDNFRKIDGFIVKEPENAVLLQSGVLVGVAGSGI